MPVGNFLIQHWFNVPGRGGRGTPNGVLLATRQQRGRGRGLPEATEASPGGGEQPAKGAAAGLPGRFKHCQWLQ